MLRRRHLGRVSFAEADDLQRALFEAREDYVLLFEHPPTYTRGIRAQEDHFLVAAELLDADVITTDRGGDVTYHAPGQAVGWAIVTVPDDPASGRQHVTRLEDAVIATVAAFDPEVDSVGSGVSRGIPASGRDWTRVPTRSRRSACARSVIAGGTAVPSTGWH